MTRVTYAQLNIGRNVGTEPMTDWLWEWFVDGAANLLVEAVKIRSFASEARPTVKRSDVQVHRGQGEWDGVTEDSAHVSLYWQHGIDTDLLTGALPSLAHMFGQDAIALVTGSTLVSA